MSCFIETNHQFFDLTKIKTMITMFATTCIKTLLFPIYTSGPLCRLSKCDYLQGSKG